MEDWDRGEGPPMTNREKVKSVLPTFEDEFRNDKEIVRMLDTAVAEALTVFYGDVIPEANSMRELVADRLDSAPEVADKISGGISRSVKMILPGWKLEEPGLGAPVAMPGGFSTKDSLYMVSMSRKVSDSGVNDEMRLTEYEPGYVLMAGEDGQWKHDIKRPYVINHEPLSVWMGDPHDTGGQAKVNMGSEVRPKSTSEVMPDVEKTVVLEAAQRFLEAYEESYGKVDLEKFRKKVEETKLGEVLQMTRAQISDQEIKSGSVVNFFQTAVLYENMLRGKKVYMIDETDIMFSRGLIERDLRRPEGPAAKIALQVLEHGEILNEHPYNYSQEYFQPHLKKAGQN